MTMSEAKRDLKEAGMTLRLRDGEYRTNFEGGREATAYYTTDLQDAYDTGMTMAKENRR